MVFRNATEETDLAAPTELVDSDRHSGLILLAGSGCTLKNNGTGTSYDIKKPSGEYSGLMIFNGSVYSFSDCAVYYNTVTGGFNTVHDP